MAEYAYLGGLVSQCGIKIKPNENKDNVVIEIDGKIVKELTFLEAKAFASELLLDSTFKDSTGGNYKYRGCRWERNWCYDADIIVKYERSD